MSPTRGFKPGRWARLLIMLAACGEGEGELALPYAERVVEVELGPGSGFGQDSLPDVVLGPPMGGGVTSGSLDVLSLGVGGWIVLGFESNPIVDGPGHDFVVFENAFYVNGDPVQVFAEPGQVSVSADGVTWIAFTCDVGEEPGTYPGCAGWRPTLRFDPVDAVPLDPEVTGGDPYDLADVGLAEARFVRVDDLSMDGDAPTAGFDLDAVGVVRQ